MSIEQDTATEWLARRTLHYMREYTLTSPLALRMALRDLLAATIVAEISPAIQSALHTVLDEIPHHLRRTGVSVKEPRIAKVRRMVLDKLSSKPECAKQPEDLTFGCDGEPFTSAHAYSLLVELEGKKLVKSVQIPGTEKRGWIKA